MERIIACLIHCRHHRYRELSPSHTRVTLYWEKSWTHHMEIRGGYHMTYPHMRETSPMNKENSPGNSLTHSKMKSYWTVSGRVKTHWVYCPIEASSQWVPGEAFEYPLKSLTIIPLRTTWYSFRPLSVQPSGWGHVISTLPWRARGRYQARAWIQIPWSSIYRRYRGWQQK